LKVNSILEVAARKLAGSWTVLVLRSANPSALINSRPRVERWFEIATRWPSDLAYPLTGPCTVWWKVTGPAGGPRAGAERTRIKWGHGNTVAVEHIAGVVATQRLDVLVDDVGPC